MAGEATLGKLTAFLELEQRQFQNGMSQAVDALKNFEKQTNDTKKALSDLSQRTGVSTGQIREFVGSMQTDKLEEMSNGLRVFASEIRAVEIVVTRAIAVFRELYAAAQEGARNQAAENFFVNAGKAISKYREATHGLISDAELMKKSNLADSMGINEKTFLNLANVAQAASLKTGQSFQYMFDSIILGTARASRLLLDNLGIIVSVKEANLRYAESLKATDESGQFANVTVQKLAASLNKQQTQAAFAEEVMRKSKGTLDELADSGGNVAANYDKVSASFENLKNVIEKLVGEGMSGPLGRMAAGLDAIIERLELLTKYGGGKGNREVGFFDMLSGGMSGAASGAGSFASAHPGMTAWTGGLAALPSYLKGFAGGASGTVVDNAEMNKATRSQDLIHYANLLESINIHVSDAAGATKKQVEEFSKGDPIIQGWIKTFQELNHEMGNPYGGARAPSTSGGSGGVPTSRGKAPHEIEEKGDTFDSLISRLDAMESAAMAASDRMSKQRQQDEMIQFRREIKAKEKEADAFAEETHGINERYVEAYKRQLKVQEEAGKAAADLGKAIVTNNASGGVSAISTLIGAAFGAPEIGKAIGEFAGPLLGALKPVINLFNELFQGVTKLVEVGLSPLLATLEPLGPSLRLLLEMVGVLVGSLARGLIPIFSEVVIIVSVVIEAFAVAVAFLSPFIEMLADLFWIFGTLGTAILAMLGGFSQMNTGIINDMFKDFTDVMLGAAIYINNAIVNIVRGLGEWLQGLLQLEDNPLGGFGQILDKSMFEDNTAATEANTNETKENTKAVRDLAREFRNLPQGYKVNYPIYNTQDPRPKTFQATPIYNAHGLRDLWRTRT